MNVNEADSTAPGEGNQELAEYKTSMGLPKWKNVEKELAQLAESRGVGYADEIKGRIETYKKYFEFQTLLYQTYCSTGLNTINALQNAADLQLKLFELEEKLKAEGINPLLSEEWMKAREQLSKEIQFIHKHKLDQAKFQADLLTAKRRTNDDALFTVEADVIESKES